MTARRRKTGLIPQTRLSGPMPWVIAIMIALTAVAAAGGLALSNLADGARAELAGGVTVQVLEPAPDARDLEAERALAALENSEAVASARRVPDDELEALLEPWLGDLATGGEDAVPVPVLIDARLDGPVTQARLANLRNTVRAVAPSAQVDAQASWLEPVFAAIASLQYLALGLVLLLAVASIAAVWLAARTALGANRDTIEIVHLLGGTDGQIARVFQRSIAVDAAVGGLVGLALGIGAILLLAGRFAQLGSGLVAEGGLGPVDWALIAAIPVAGVALAALTARLTVATALRRML